MFREPFPIIYSDDVERLARFYRDAFGFEETFRWPAENGDAKYVFMSLGPHGVGIGRPPQPNDPWRRPIPRGSRGLEICVYTDDTDAAAERLRALGAKELTPPSDQPWGERLTYFVDPDGNPLHVTAPIHAT
jgi:lactoylglutathione lyase